MNHPKTIDAYVLGINNKQTDNSYILRVLNPILESKMLNTITESFIMENICN